MLRSLNDLVDRGLAVNDMVWHMTAPGISSDAFELVSRECKCILPRDFIEICTVVSYEGSNKMEFFQFDADKDDWNGIIKNNLELRRDYAEQSLGQSNLEKILVLSDNDGGSAFMITQNDANKKTPIIWCDAGDMYWYAIGGKLPHPHDEWPSFTDFFEYLVVQEEEMLKEQEK